MEIECCPYCCSPIGRLHYIHNSDSDFDGGYYVCIVCEHEFTEEEYEALTDGD